MRILLIAYDNESYVSYFPLGLAYIASALQMDDHEVEIYEQNVYHYSEEHLREYIVKNSFDAIGLGAVGGYYPYRKARKIAEAINSIDNRPFFWLGGHLPSPDPEFFLKEYNADLVMIGESDVTCREVMKVLETGSIDDMSKVDGVAYIDSKGEFIQTKQRAPIQNIDDIPYPAWDLFTMEHYVLYRIPNISGTDRTMQMLSGRGCPFQCNFCYRMDKGFRPRSTESIVDEIKEIKKRFNVNCISFNDELLMSSVDRASEIAEAFIREELNIKFSCNGRLNYASKDKGMLELLKKAGCVYIGYGIESMDNDSLKRMRKNLTTDMVIKGVENTISAGISPGLYMIFGNLDEDMDVLKKDVDFLLKYGDGSELRTIRPVTPYPGTELYNIAIERGYIKDIRDFYENKHVNSDLLTCNFSKLSDEEFYNALDWANGILLDDYLEKSRKANELCLTKLYKEHDASFRGFRPV